MSGECDLRSNIDRLPVQLFGENLFRGWRVCVGERMAVSIRFGSRLTIATGDLGAHKSGVEDFLSSGSSGAVAIGYRLALSGFRDCSFSFNFTGYLKFS